MKDNFKKILNELSYRVSSGIPDLTNEQHLIKLWDILKEHNWSVDARVELLKNISGIPIEKIDPKKVKVNEIIKAVTELGQIISEASVYDSKYSNGSRFMISSKRLASVERYAGESMPDGVYTKVKETKADVEIIQNKDKSTEFWVKSEKSGKVYHIKGTASEIGTWFIKAGKNPGDINFNTATLEASALLGLKIDTKGYLDRFNASTADSVGKIAQEFISEVSSALGGGDFASNNLGSMKTAPINQIVLVAAIAAGMQKFNRDKGTNGWNFVHGKIDTYYKAEQENPHIVTEGGKDNTADAILVNSPIGSFLSNMKTQPVKYDSSGLCKLDSGEEFYQISLKKSVDKAQLGKITSDFAEKYNLISNADLINVALTEGIEKEILDEGLRDLFDKGREFIKSTGKKVLDGIRAAATKVQKFYKGIIGSFKSATSKANKDGDDLLRKIAPTLKLNEAKMSQTDIIQGIADNYNQGNKKPLNTLVKNCNDSLKRVISLTNSPGMGYAKTGTTSLRIPSSVDIDVVIKFLANYKALLAFQSVASNSKGNAKSATEIYTDFLDLEKDMYFGRTSLPLFKVYGLNPDGGGTPYTFLKSGQEYKEDRKSAFESKQDIVSKVFIVYVESKAGYGTMSAWVFSKFDNNGTPLFNNINFRTNKAGALTFTIEGSKTQSWDWMLSQKWGAGLA